jgi:N utilization substance protein B
MDRKEKRLSRCLSLQVYYAWILSETHPKEILDYMHTLLISKEESVFFNDNVSNDIINNTYKLVELTIQKCDEVDNYISSKLKNWDLKRIALIDKLILRLSITEMIFFNEVPPKVSIVEGVHII